MVIRNQYKADTQRYCSMKCYRECWIEKTCVCGKVFKVSVDQGAPRKFCKKECWFAVRAARSRVAPEPEAVPGCRWVPLTRGLCALVDEEDYEMVSAYRWIANTPIKSTRTYAIGQNYDEIVPMHRLILNAPKGVHVDHINLNGLDNRRQNLRPCSPSQNHANQVKSHGTSRFKGVSRNGRRWEASIVKDYRKHALGFYDNEEDAAKAYDEAARRLHGEFARMNFPMPGERAALELEVA